MENGDGSNEFMKQFSGSVTANVVFAVGILIYKFFESRCKHSKCSSNTRFCKCSADNYETERAESNKDIKNAVQFESRMQKMQPRNDKVLQEKHFAVEKLELRDPESISAGDSIVVKGETLV